jgi:alpha-tubulin suppressor-like RCC1 family protein
VKIKDVKCGSTFTFFLQDTGTLWACGMNDLGQLGIDSTEAELMNMK